MRAELYKADPPEGRKQLLARAKEAEAKGDDNLAKYHHYEVASAAFQIGIVLASATVITGMIVLSYIATAGATAWVRLDGGFAVRACKVIDISDSGVQIEIDASHTVPNEFNFALSRAAGSGRRARIKWRRGSQIGAEFL